MTLVLTPTLETEIAAKRAEIDAQEVHTTRASYIAVVQPLQDELQTLIEQNEAIIAANAAIPPTFEEVKATKLESINNQCQTYILSKYPLTIQSSAWGGVYGAEFANTLRIFLSSCVELENASANAVAAMTDVETVNAFEVDFTLVV